MTLCGPRMASLRGSEPGVVSQDKPVHWLQVVIKVRAPAGPYAARDPFSH